MFGDFGMYHPRSNAWLRMLPPAQTPHSTSDTEPPFHHQDTLAASQTQSQDNNPQHNTTHAFATQAQLVLSDSGSLSSVLWQLWLLGGLDPEQHSTSDTEPPSHHQDTLAASQTQCQDNNPQHNTTHALPHKLNWSCQTVAHFLLSCGSCGFWVG